MNGQTAITHVFTTDTKGRPLSTTYTDNTCQTGCFSGEAFLNWDPCGNLLSMTAANGTLVASYEYDKGFSKKINEYNPYAIEMPLQYNGRDGTVTPTYGGSTPINIDIHNLPDASMIIGNPPLPQSNGRLCCYIDGYSEDPMSPVDGADDDCTDGDGCQDVSLGNCGYTACNRLFNGADPETNIPLEGDNTDLLHDFEPTKYNCTLIRCCHIMYKHSKGNLENGDEHGGEMLDDDGETWVVIDQDMGDARIKSMGDWMNKKGLICQGRFWD